MEHQTLMDLSTRITSTLGGLAIIWAMFSRFIPTELRSHLIGFIKKYLSNYHEFTIEAYEADSMSRPELYKAAEAYLSSHCSGKASKCRIELGKDSNRFLVSVGNGVEVTDSFRRAKIWWKASKHEQSKNDESQEQRRYYKLSFHKQHRMLIEGQYLEHVLEEGRSIMAHNRQRRLYTNISRWCHVPFHHPSTFETLAMDLVKKQEIIDDLDKFRRGKEYYSRIGKAWKRGYLLYGPPGTGKSSMIAAIANFLEYDIYDLELTTVKSNSDLRRLFIEITRRSIIVIEDIDCSLDLTGKRKDSKKKKEEDKNDDERKVTLSGLLNFMDGLWSSCGEERILIFTTNHVEKLDPALIRMGRMDKHIEMSYCDFESFKVLARNYLGIGSHELFGTIRRLLEEVKITPADVAESLMCVSLSELDAGQCLERLINELDKRNKAPQLQDEKERIEDVHGNGV